VDFTPDGKEIAVSHGDSPRISTYPWNPGFGTKYADPATLPTGSGEWIAISSFY
jgi:hypothetical protein